MNKAAEFRKNAEQCRTLAKQMAQEQYRDQLLKMAESWERFADDYKRAGASPVQLESALARPQKK
jgi:hypothetical protein